ncbi:ABC transporter ATP-binding protein [Endozoicomonas montiporae]|uniref:NitT/TauT family transport system ATP-binding protein n=1 Tax=Endozoicomonas montiporae CL-33 TaxID=570277 RepID=A0A142BGI0_9GAMM|nr:ATP-binding cassette domain-containing protein [Endozoicomonas montiporae]AMO57856.1 NitT/TauT family transport system ATP-binding protein [Endozoicomonas montiporae CL-33]
MENCLEISNLSFAYSKQQVLTDISFSQKRSEFLGIVGESGCGKSTLLRLINQLLQPDEGSIQRYGLSSILFQDDRLLPWKTCRENVRLAMSQQPPKHHDGTKQITSLFKKLRIPEVRHQYPHHLSGGMRQRVALARALISQPDLLLLDEPFAAVDHFTRQTLISELLCELKQLRKTRPVSMILVTHNIDEALFLCDRILILGKNPATIQHSLDVPELPADWQTFYQSNDATRLKLNTLSLLEDLQ